MRARARALVALLAACGCAPEREGSSGSTLDPPRTWQAARGLAGEPLGEWVSPVGPLPPDTLSVTLLATGDGDESVSIGVRDPQERLLTDPQQPELSPNRLLRGRGTVVGMLPSATATLPLAQNFSVSALRMLATPSAPDERPVTVTAWVKRSGAGAGLPARQELPLALFLVGGPYDESRLAVALAEAGRAWRAAGIELREPLRIPIGGDDAQRFAHVGIDPARGSDSPALRALFALSERGPEGALALFLVPELSADGAGFPVWALAGSIPVPPRRGTVRSGLAMNGGLLGVDPVWAGQVLAHEIGHALGLYHTTERDLVRSGAIHDPIGDTPECPPDADADGDGTLSAGECAEHDAHNLMFWAVVRHATALTAGQAEIARRAALAR